MVRGHLESIIIYDVYVIDFERESCNAFGKKNFFDIYRINHYYIDFHFKYNKITLEKVNYFENKTGFNLIKY